MTDQTSTELASASRRAVVGGLGALVATSGAGAATSAEESGKVFGIYCGRDMRSYLCELTGGGAIPAYRAQVGGPVAAEAAKPSSFWGGVIILLAGELEVTVSAGDIRRVTGKAGDTFIFIDTRGDGHALTPVGPTPVQHIHVRLKEPWTALAKAYRWPDNVLPPEEIGPAVNF